MKLLTILITLLTACTWNPNVNEIAAPEGESVAVEIIRMHYARIHGELPPYTGKITWTDDECIQVDWRDVHACVGGAYYTGDARIYVVDRGYIWKSALVHELAHYWLDEEGDSDGDHSRLDWWDMVPIIEGKLKAWEETEWPVGVWVGWRKDS